MGGNLTKESKQVIASCFIYNDDEFAKKPMYYEYITCTCTCIIQDQDVQDSTHSTCMCRQILK